MITPTAADPAADRASGTGPDDRPHVPGALVPAPPDDAGDRAPRWSVRASTASAFVTAMTRPASWAFGLLGFLAGGGVVLVAAPILVLPTPTSLQSDLGGPVNRLVLGTPMAELVLLAVAAALGALALILVATVVGTWAERHGIEITLEAARDEGLPAPATDLAGAPGAGRMTVIRLLSLIPVGIALAVAWGPLYDAGYRELILPDDLVTPLPIRVLLDVPGLVALVVVAWLLADAAAAVGVRRLVVDRRSVLSAWALGWVTLVRQPLRMLGAAAIGLLSMLLLAGPALLASAAGWTRVRDALLEGRDGPEVLVVVAAWVATWLAALVLIGVGAAARSAVWTFALDPNRHAGTAGRV